MVIKADEQYEYAFARNDDEVDHYVNIRRQLYRERYRDDNVGKDCHDRCSDIILAKHHGAVVGGIRITSVDGNELGELPMAGYGFLPTVIYFDANIDECIFTEASKLCVLPPHKCQGVVFINLLKCAVIQATKRKTNYALFCGQRTTIKHFARTLLEEEQIHVELASQVQSIRTHDHQFDLKLAYARLENSRRTNGVSDQHTAYEYNIVTGM